MNTDKQTPKNRRGLQRLIFACAYSLQGLGHAFRGEAAFRQELLLGCLSIPVALSLPILPVYQLIIIVLTCAVIVTELLNSAIEKVVDQVSPEFHILAKQAKDMGSAAVFVSLTALAVSWLWALWPLFPGS